MGGLQTRYLGVPKISEFETSRALRKTWCIWSRLVDPFASASSHGVRRVIVMFPIAQGESKHVYLTSEPEPRSSYVPPSPKQIIMVPENLDERPVFSRHSVDDRPLVIFPLLYANDTFVRATRISVKKGHTQ